MPYYTPGSTAFDLFIDPQDARPNHELPHRYVLDVTSQAIPPAEVTTIYALSSEPLDRRRHGGFLNAAVKDVLHGIEDCCCIFEVTSFSKLHA